ncbi:hypothetical protein MPSEU_000509300 [Mayamaea pseudoterrestris]|nr:hypothetical protein MPSEU_000509300 [Mayamaea pseudoterrestris]
MTMQEGVDGDGKQWWLGTPARLKQLTSENIGGFLTLSAMHKQYHEESLEETTETGEQLVIICSAMPSSTLNGQKYIVGNSKLSLSDTDGHEMMEEGLLATEDPFVPVSHMEPSGFPAPQAVVPILACLSRMTRAEKEDTSDDWYAKIHSDIAVFPRGDKLLQPVLFVIHTDELPPDNSEEHEIIGGTGHWEGAPNYQHGEQPVLAYATDKDPAEAEAKFAPYGKCFFVPPNHGIPLGLAIDPTKCRTVDQFKHLCQEFTGLPGEAYEWMEGNHLLALWLKGCEQSPSEMQTEMWLMSQVTDTWNAWKESPSLLAQQTFLHPELMLRYRILWDHLLHTLEPAWRDKLLLLGQNAQTIFNNSPELSSFHEPRVENMWYLAGLLNIKTTTWIKNFELGFQRRGLPDWLESFARVDITATTTAADISKLRIVSKQSQMKDNTPGTEPRRRRNIGELVAKVFQERFVATVGSPLQIKHSKQDNDPPTRTDGKEHRDTRAQQKHWCSIT